MRILRTHNFSLIQSACERAHTESSVIVIVGRKGFGMTTALRFYYENGPMRVLYLRFSRNVSMKESLRWLAEQACPGMEAYSNSEFELVRLIRSKIRERLERYLIIIDDFTYQNNLFAVVHDLCDTPKCIGLVVGTNQRTVNLVNRNSNKSHKPCIRSFARQMNVVMLQKPRRDEIAAIANANGIEDTSTISTLVLECPDYHSLEREIKTLKKLPPC